MRVLLSFRFATQKAAALFALLGDNLANLLEPCSRTKGAEVTQQLLAS
jgi:hypothetical protein